MIYTKLFGLSFGAVDELKIHDQSFNISKFNTTDNKNITPHYLETLLIRHAQLGMVVLVSA